MTDEGAMPWLKSYPEGIDWGAPLPPEPVNAALDRAEARYGKRPAIDFMGKICTYGLLGHLVRRAAKGLAALGIGKGDRVGLLLPNTPYHVVCFHAALELGAVVVNFNPLYSEDELVRQANDAGVRVMVTLDLAMILDKMVAAAPRTRVERVVVCSMAAALPPSMAVMFRLFKRGEVAHPTDAARFSSFKQLIDNDGRIARAVVDPLEDAAVLQYTGGTTGVPKGAVLTHANLAANRRQVAQWCPSIEPGAERVLGVLPLFHVFAMTVVMNLAVEIGATMILLPRFKLEQVLGVIHKKRPTLMPVVPTILNALNNSEATARHDLTSLKYCISGGAPLPIEVLHRFQAITGCHVVEGYGLSETAPVATCNPTDGRVREGSIGLPLQGTRIEVRALDDPGRVLGVGERGQITVRGPQVMRGYWNRPEETAAVFDDGALLTGDVGYVDADGYAFLVDRLKDVILVNGYNVYPRTIEEALYEHPSVAEATVIGLPDAERGEAPKAFVVLKEDAAPVDEAGLMAFLRPKLSPLERPRAIEVRDSLPKTMIGKLSKKELVAEERDRRARATAPATEAA
ncbi:MAG: long-chain fatty acid--CoA ligase [Geminicoccaceae bacterium]|nr:long-chain fatty acid--CoA ligase [Geminicoccaceae bacterium]